MTELLRELERTPTVVTLDLYMGRLTSKGSGIIGSESPAVVASQAPLVISAHL